MIEYKGFHIEARRIGTKGEWCARYWNTEVDRDTMRFAGVGAKQKAIDEAKSQIDSIWVKWEESAEKRRKAYPNIVIERKE